MPKIPYLDATLLVTGAVTRFTRSYGANTDKPHVAYFLNNVADLNNPNFVDAYMHVRGVPFAHFYANSRQAFNSTRSNLWGIILTDVRSQYPVVPVMPNLPVPQNWSVITNVGMFATLLVNKVAPYE